MSLNEFPKICQMKGCEKLRRFLHSIQNHIYWTAASSANGPERVAKWTSILNHVQDKHTEKKKQRQEQMAGCWNSAILQVGESSLQQENLEGYGQAKSTPPDLSNVEAFHSVTLRFAPKNVVFPFLGILCRLYLAALHYNENAGCPQATSAVGEPLFKVTFPKGENRFGEVETLPTFNYDRPEKEEAISSR